MINARLGGQRLHVDHGTTSNCLIQTDKSRAQTQLCTKVITKNHAGYN